MAGAVGAGDAGAVEAEDHREAVQRDVVDDLVPRPVEERRVDRDDRAEAAHRHAGGAGDGVLLGDADVEESGRGTAPGTAAARSGPASLR
jgi:hypothetical protein